LVFISLLGLIGLGSCVVRSAPGHRHQGVHSKHKPKKHKKHKKSKKPKKPKKHKHR
jgi:hypothetical protein